MHVAKHVDTSILQSCPVQWFFFCFVGGAILCYSQSGDSPQEYLARFGYKLNYESNFYKKKPCIFLVSYFDPCIIEIWKKFLKFGRIMAIEKLQKHMILAFLKI
jgi:hypothetical protein